MCYPRLISVIFIFLCLSGCVSMKAPDSSGQFKARSVASRLKTLSHIKSWQTAGVFSISQSHKAEIARFSWLESSPVRYKIDISSALNLYRLQLVASPGRVRLQKNSSKKIVAKTPEGLMKKVLGWYLPLTPLKYWYKGMPAPRRMGKAVGKYDRYGHLVFLRQAGWVLHLSAYLNIPKARIDVPQVIQLKRNGLSIKIVTRQWVLQPAVIKAKINS